MNEYRVLVSGGTGETELKKSRFIAHVAPAKTEEEAMNYVNQIKKEFYDARHNPYAYVLGRDGDKVKYSDDGEPGQTAGLPIFNVLKETGVRDAVIVVTRYFGGTLLGAGPLARMYGEAASLGLKNSKTGIMRYGIEFDVLCDYGNGERIRNYFSKNGINLVNTEYTDMCKFTARCPEIAFNDIKKDLISITSSNVTITEKKPEYFIDNA